MRWSGKHARVYIGSYQLAELQNWELRVTARLADVTSIDDDYTQRIGLDQDIELTAEKMIQSVSGTFDPLGGISDMAGQPYMVTCFSPAGSGALSPDPARQATFLDGSNAFIIFQGLMYMEEGSLQNPNDAIKSNVRFRLATNPVFVPDM